MTKILAVGLGKLGVDTCIITSSLNGGFLDLRNFKTELFSEKFRRAGPFIRSLATLGFSIKKAIDDFHPDAVVSMTEDTVNLGISKLVKRELRTIQYVHFTNEEEASSSCNDYLQYYRFPEWFNRFFLWSTGVIACNSLYTQASIRKNWGKEAKVVYPAIDYIFETRPSNLGCSRDNILLCVGRFTRLKRQDFLIRVFRKIKREVKDAELILAGFRDPRHTQFLDSLLQLDGEDIAFRINPSDEELIRLYSSAKVYCHPRIAEHFGLAPLEAMSQGTPVVAYDVGGIRETVISGKTGYLVKTDEEFARYIISLLELRESRWQEMHRNSVERAGQFSTDRFVKEFSTLLAS